MANSMRELIEKDSELRERFISKAFEQRRINDFPSFQDAIFQAFDTDRGKRASAWFDDSTLKILFESEEAKARLRQNVTEQEFNQIYGEVERGEAFVVRTKPTGEKLTRKQVMVVEVPQKKQISGYSRIVYGKEVSVKSYYKGYNKWSNPQIRFLQVRKAQGILTAKQISREYNTHFTDSPRTESSIKTQLYRV